MERDGGVNRAVSAVLTALAEWDLDGAAPKARGRLVVPAPGVPVISGVGIEDVNDAVTILEERGWATVRRGMGTAPYKFLDVQLTAEGRLEAERRERRQDVDARRVFVVHGRDALAQKAMFDLLRALGLIPIEWEDARSQTGSASPHNSEIGEAGMASAKAVVVLFTPDEVVRLRPDLRCEPGDDQPGWQPRPNVVFEAGSAFELYPTATVVVEVGNMRPVSDLAGRNTVRVATGPEWRQKLKKRLEDAGCAVEAPGTD